MSDTGRNKTVVTAISKISDRPVAKEACLVVIYGLVVTEAVAVASGAMPAWRMLPTWLLQAGLVLLFATAFHYQTLRRWLAA